MSCICSSCWHITWSSDAQHCSSETSSLSLHTCLCKVQSPLISLADAVNLYTEDGDRFSCIVIQLCAKEEPVKVNWMMGPTYMHNYLSKFCSVLDYSSWTTSVQSITFWIVKRKRRDKPRVWIMDRSLLQASFKLSAKSMLFYLQQEWSGEYTCLWHWSEWMTCQWRLRVSV